MLKLARAGLTLGALASLVVPVGVASADDVPTAPVILISDAHVVLGSHETPDATGKYSSVQVQFSWSATDPDGVCEQSMTYTDPYANTVTTTYLDPDQRTIVLPVHTNVGDYHFNISAGDCDTGIVTGANYRYYLFTSDQAAASLAPASAWAVGTCRCYSGGSDYYTKTPGATASMSYLATQAVLISSRGPARGTGVLTLDGVPQTTFSLQGAATNRFVAAELSGSPTQHVAGVAAVSNKRVDVDEWLIGGGQAISY